MNKVVPEQKQISTGVAKAGKKGSRFEALGRLPAHGLLQDILGVVAFKSLCPSQDRLDPQCSPMRSVLLRDSLP